MEVLKAEQIDLAEGQTVTDTVASIIRRVREAGDDALRAYLRQFDSVEIDDLRVSDADIQKAVSLLPQTMLEDIQFSIERIRAFANAQRRTLTEFEQEMIPGAYLGQRVIPIESVGAYVPGGRYPLLSSAQMAIIPAKVAGVGSIRVCTPPTKSGEVHPAVLAAAHLSGADEIYRVGGAQAIAALAYGTESIAPVHKITGPGNAFVTEAKRQVHGQVGIDLLAGPSEVLVLADHTANPVYIAADLLAQAEHDVNARVALVTTDRDLGHAVIREIHSQLQTLPTAATARAAWERRGQVFYAESMDEAIALVNDWAPEHLHVQTADAYALRDRFINYGSLFLGALSSVVYADKVCGTNHILPTRAAAKYTGGVWVGTFLKVVTYQRIEQQGVEALAPHCVRQSQQEGLIGHLRSANIRWSGELDVHPFEIKGETK
ncbi:histidinol dehydrogenase [Ectobacillus ponti]|uniref:Histidinol dehydrogenase n=1 Tax=Ectobacillus ponti TaxID=2961894 RepID=A0AA41XCP0_9BACI|nr:histidinol dehydrogenase [Ectobacillus ponti]MCP8970448.1 histidinol dehydrogenase [Ectobacillus ponti]